MVISSYMRENQGLEEEGLGKVTRIWGGAGGRVGTQPIQLQSLTSRSLQLTTSLLSHCMRRPFRNIFPWMNEWMNEMITWEGPHWVSGTLCSINSWSFPLPLPTLPYWGNIEGLLSKTRAQSEALHILKCCAVETGEEQGSVNNSPPCLGEIKNIFHCKTKVLVIWDFQRLGQNTASNGRTELVTIIFFQVKWEVREVHRKAYRLMQHSVWKWFHFHFTRE